MGEIQDAIRLLAETDQYFYESKVCKVSNINTTKYTCTCTPIDGTPEFYGVLLNANGVKGFVLIPKENSFVILTQTSDTTSFVSMVSEVQQVYLNGDNEDGLVTVKSLKTKLNDLESKVNDLILACSSQVVTLAPSGTFPLASFFTGVTPLTPTQQSEIENPKIKHGSS